MSFSDPSGDWQSQTGAVRARSLRTARKRVLIGGFDPGPSFVTRSITRPATRSSSAVTRPSSSSVANRIVEQIPHHRRKQRGISGQPDFFGPARLTATPRWIRQHAGRPRALGQKVVEIQELRPERNALRLGAREVGTLRPPTGQAGRLFADDSATLGIRLRRILPGQRHLRLRSGRPTPASAVRVKRQP